MLKGKSDKLEAKTEVCMFLGYSNETKGYLFYNHKDNKVFVSTNAKFLEDDYVNNFNPRSKDRKSTRLNSSHALTSRMPSSA